MADGVPQHPRSVDDVFKDFRGRRAALVKALSTDIDQFFEDCDPEKDNLCIYGHANGNWEVTLPVELVPAKFPEPVLGINFSRDAMELEPWLASVASHSDSWLLAVAFHIGARYGFEKTERKRLFNMINELPTILEVISGTDKNRPKGPSTSSSKKTKSKSKGKSKYEDDEDFKVEEEEEDSEALCGTCAEKYSSDEFWIYCDFCETWYHGKCVKITPTMAQSIEHYECPICYHKRQRS